MALLTECPECKRRWPVDPAELGQEAACPECGTVAATRDVGHPEGLRRHRGGLVFGLGIASLVVVGIFGPFAWWMGARDLKAMARGEMDPAGLENTRAGVRMGQIGTAKCVIELLLILAIVAAIIYLAIVTGLA